MMACTGQLINAHEKMHHAVQTTNKDTLGILEGGSDFLLRKLQKKNNFKSSSEVRAVSSFTWRNSDNRYSVLTVLTLEPNGHWRIDAVPLHCPDSECLGSGVQVSMDCLHLVYPRPINSVRADRQKVTKGTMCGGNYPTKSLANRSFLGSTVQHQAQNKTLTNEAKWSEIPQNFGQKSLPGCESSCSILNSSNVLKSSTVCINNSKVDNVDVVKKQSKKKSKGTRRKKKCPGQTGSTEPEVLSAEHPRVGAVIGTCHSNNRDSKDSLVLSSTQVESSWHKNGVHNPEVPKTCTSIIKGVDMLEKAVTENHSVGTFENQQLSKDSADYGSRNANRTQVSSYDDLRSRDCSNASGSFSVLIHSSRVQSTKFCHVSKQSEKESCGTGLTETPASDFRKGSFSCKSLSNNVVDKSQGGQYRRSSDVHVTVPSNRNKQNKQFSQFSSIPRSRSTGNFHGHPGKGGSHTVWQKVQKKGTRDCTGDSTEVPVFPQCNGTLDEASFLKRSFDASENEKQLKYGVSRKLKSKGGTALRHECKLNTIKGPHADTVNSHFCPKVTCPDEMDTLESVCNTNSILKNQVIYDLNHPLPKSCSSSDHSRAVQVQSLMFLPHPFGNSVRQRQENIPVSEGMQNCSSGYIMQKWVPIGLKDLGLTNSAGGLSEHSDSQAAESLTAVNTVKSESNFNSPEFVPQGVLCIGKSSANVTHSSHDDERRTPQLKNQVASVLEEQNNHTAAHCLNTESGVLSTSGSVPDRIVRAVIDACRVQLASETVERASGHPIAEFERLLHNSCPVIHQLPHLVCHTCSRDQFGGLSLCRHERPNISLGCVWQWYEEHSNYGLEIRAHDYGSTKRFSSFFAYFVPYLSAVQLFRNHNKHSGDTENKISSSEVPVTCGYSETSERSSCVDHLPIFSALFPQPQVECPSVPPHVNHVCSREPSSSSAKDVASLGSIEITLSSDAELLFEYFESEQPQQRRPLYEKIQELVRCDGPSQYRGYGDPTTLNFTTLNDLHPKSWYSVAWYPIYRIPEDNFRASFLTFHSLGHLMRRSARINSQTVENCIVCPVVGLQSYNAQSECWFKLRHSPQGASDLNASGILKDRLKTLEETASLMARAVVNKGSLPSANRHPDYEFFRSRKALVIS